MPGKTTHMKKSIIIAASFILGLFGCTSQKKIVENAPFVIDKPSCQQFAAGREEGGSGFVLKIPIASVTEAEVTFGDVYFRGHVLSSTTQKEGNKQVLICEFTNKKDGPKPDIIMHADPMEEIGNQPPSISKQQEKEFPFELAKDEAVLSFRAKGKNKWKFYKISGVKDKEPLIYPERPKN